VEISTLLRLESISMVEAHKTAKTMSWLSCVLLRYSKLASNLVELWYSGLASMKNHLRRLAHIELGSISSRNEVVILSLFSSMKASLVFRRRMEGHSEFLKLVRRGIWMLLSKSMFQVAIPGKSSILHVLSLLLIIPVWHLHTPA